MDMNLFKDIEGYPADYKYFKVGDNIELIDGSGKAKYYRVVNRDKVTDIEKQDTTNWLLSSGGSYNPRDISDWLEPENDVLMILAFGMHSDRNVEVKISNPQAIKLFGIKSDVEAVVTPRTSPADSPTLTLYCWGTTLIPNFDISNPTEYTIGYLKFVVRGFKYRLRELTTKPSVFDTVDLSHITS
jgi:acyl-CoA synthetase (AMP-forming)/AMP-acid ligase II